MGKFTLILNLGSSINDVTQFWTIFEPSPPIVTCFITKSLVMLSHNPWPLHLRLWRNLWTIPYKSHSRNWLKWRRCFSRTKQRNNNNNNNNYETTTTTMKQQQKTYFRFCWLYYWLIGLTNDFTFFVNELLFIE